MHVVWDEHQGGASGDPVPHHYHVLLGFPVAIMYKGRGDRGGGQEGK